MTQHLGTTKGEGAGDLGIKDFLAGDASQGADFGARHREHPLDPIAIEIGVPHIVRTGREHRKQAAIVQHHVARWGDDEARLEIEPRKMAIAFISVARKVQAQPLRHPAERRVLRAVGGKAHALGKFGDADPSGIAGEQIFGQHRQLDRTPGILLDEDCGGADRAFDICDMREDLGAGSGGVGAAFRRTRGKLHRHRGIGGDAQSPRLPGFIKLCGSS